MTSPEFEIEFDDSQFSQLRELGQNVTNKVLELTATMLWGEIRREAPVDHGRLAGSFQLEGGGDVWRILSGVEYAIPVLEGTRPHEIVPVNAKALFWPGAPHPVARVMHPGTPANPYVDRAWGTTEGRINEFIEQAVRDASS